MWDFPWRTSAHPFCLAVWKWTIFACFSVGYMLLHGIINASIIGKFPRGTFLGDFMCWQVTFEKCLISDYVDLDEKAK